MNYWHSRDNTLTTHPIAFFESGFDQLPVHCSFMIIGFWTFLEHKIAISTSIFLISKSIVQTLFTISLSMRSMVCVRDLIVLYFAKCYSSFH